ncbi:hypothetical protein X759_13330 [Mesorhizobium sp. LSHC420B00]|nr:hypothetical protein X759_13330 [Mesorhizobium sp. LSHC420B00]
MVLIGANDPPAEAGFSFRLWRCRGPRVLRK